MTTLTDMIKQRICDRLTMCEIYDVDGKYVNRVTVKRMVDEEIDQVIKEFNGGDKDGSI